MKLRCSKISTRCGRPATRGAERGTATLVVLVLLLLMAALIAINSSMVRQLKRELQRVEKVQLRKYDGRAVTNPPPTVPAQR